MLPQQNTNNYTGRFIMFSEITNFYNKNTKGPSLMELFTAMTRAFRHGSLQQ
jgi:hypothetical protein